MRLGVLEQVGAPHEVYDRPANTFVAGFIGSPAMTFGRFSAERTDGRLRLTAGGLVLERSDPGEVPGEVVAGVRPEHVRPWSDGGRLLGPFSGLIESVEAHGRETFVGVRAASDLEFVVRFDGASDSEIGESIEFGIEPERVHLFDAESGAAVGRR
jgi:ABC-type sugar transport system ATPase subunit